MHATLVCGLRLALVFGCGCREMYTSFGFLIVLLFSSRLQLQNGVKKSEEEKELEELEDEDEDQGKHRRKDRRERRVVKAEEEEQVEDDEGEQQQPEEEEKKVETPVKVRPESRGGLFSFHFHFGGRGGCLLL